MPKRILVVNPGDVISSMPEFEKKYFPRAYKKRLKEEWEEKMRRDPKAHGEWLAKKSLRIMKKALADWKKSIYKH